MKKIVTILMVFLLLGTVSVFAGGAKEEAKEEAKPAKAAAFLGEDTIRYFLAEWEKKSGKKLTFNEAPDLKKRVSSGELPSVEKRVGEDPMVVQPVEAIGTYGGVWRRSLLGVLGAGIYFNECLVTFDYKHEKIVPNIAKAWDVSPDGKSYTFYLRKGMKWSDGEPFTADDLVFRWNDYIMNEELTPGGGGSTYSPGGEPGKITKIDDYTVKYSFAVPHVLWLEWQGDKTMQLWAPSHYLKQYHAKYAKKADLDKILKDEDYATWTDLFKAKLDEPIAPTNVDAPTIEPWIMIEEVGGAVQRYVRNPFYWKVDIEGNQLPYINEVHEYLMGDAEAILLKALAGECDVQGLRISSLANYPTVKENEAKGDYKIVPMQNPATNYGAISINMFHKDPVLRELFWNKDFRIALSIAIDRKEINQLIFKGLGVPSQPAPPKSFAYYNEKLSTQYTEYDVNKANKILDDLGLKWDKDHKNRLRPDGKPLKLVNFAFTPWPPENVDMQEMVKTYWAAIGIEMSIKPIERKLWVEKVKGCDYDIASYGINRGFPGNPPALYCTAVPIGTGICHWAQKWCLWFSTDGKEGEEPPAEVKRLKEINSEYQKEVSPEKRLALNKEVLAIQADRFDSFIGLVNEPDAGRWHIVKNNIGNGIIQGGTAFRIAVVRWPTNMACYYYKY